MRVLMISKACISGIYQRKLEHIARMGVELMVVVPPSWRDERGEIHLERAHTEGYQLEVLPLGFNGSYHLHYYRGLGKIIRDFKPDILHIDEEPYNLAAWQAMYHIRKTKTKSLFFSWQNIDRVYPPPFIWGESWMLRHVDYVIVGTDSAAEVWRHKGYMGPVSTIPQFGTDPDLFTPLEAVPQRPFSIGYIGRLVEEKGVHLLLRAAAWLTGDWRLYILGAGPEKERLQKEATRLDIGGKVTFDDWLPSTEVPAYFHKLDALVLPSQTRPKWKEQFGRVLVEAMASGVPVIGSDSGAIPGVVGDAGLIFPEGDMMELVNHLHTLQYDDAKHAEYARKGRERFLAHFTHEQIAEATVAVYRKLLP